MNSSFQKLWEASRLGQDYWDQGPSDDALSDNVIKLIKKGIELRPDRADGNTFWDDFLTVFGSNTDAAAELLDVSPDIITSWSHQVRKAIQEAKKKDPHERASVMNTGV